MTENKKFEISSATLHIMAMFFMLCDHLWGTVVPGNDWLTCIGRIALPIFAFMTAEGFYHTKSLKKYVSRLLIFALISEIPFDLAISGSFFYLLHQNVLWTFLIAIALMYLNERAKEKKLWLRVCVAVGTVLLGTVLGLVTFVDYYHAGVLTVLAFYFFRGRKWWNFLLQALCLWIINVEILGGLGYEFELFGKLFFFKQQSLAMLALIPIWLYRGKQGPYNKTLRFIYYSFYPIHLLILALIAMI